jgi:hypothetical protein
VKGSPGSVISGQSLAKLSYALTLELLAEPDDLVLDRREHWCGLCWGRLERGVKAVSPSVSNRRTSSCTQRPDTP